MVVYIKKCKASSIKILEKFSSCDCGKVICLDCLPKTNAYFSKYKHRCFECGRYVCKECWDGHPHLCEKCQASKATVDRKLLLLLTSHRYSVTKIADRLGIARNYVMNLAERTSIKVHHAMLHRPNLKPIETYKIAVLNKGVSVDWYKEWVNRDNIALFKDIHTSINHLTGYIYQIAAEHRLTSNNRYKKARATWLQYNKHKALTPIYSEELEAYTPKIVAKALSIADIARKYKWLTIVHKYATCKHQVNALVAGLVWKV